GGPGRGSEGRKPVVGDHRRAPIELDQERRKPRSRRVVVGLFVAVDLPGALQAVTAWLDLELPTLAVVFHVEPQRSFRRQAHKIGEVVVELRLALEGEIDRAARTVELHGDLLPAVVVLDRAGAVVQRVWTGVEDRRCRRG